MSDSVSANVALALEYEATCLLPEHRTAAGIELADVNVFVNAVLALVEPVETHFMQARNCATRLMNWSWKPLSMVVR